jgi:hypothetical protein
VKKEYCCEQEAIGCQNTFPEWDEGNQNPVNPTVSPEAVIPLWLNQWLGDMALSFKFVLSASFALGLGCCCGMCTYAHYLKNHAAKQRAQTEQELMAEVKKLLHRVGAKTGEIAVTLMWDTNDDLDLHLRLPNGLGEISAENPSAHGGRLDIDGNHCLERATMKPIENIYWPEIEHTGRGGEHPPPSGTYTISVKCFARMQYTRDAKLTVVARVGDKTEIWHYTMVVGRSEVVIGTFTYNGPDSHDNHHHHGSHHAGANSSSKTSRKANSSGPAHQY